MYDQEIKHKDQQFQIRQREKKSLTTQINVTTDSKYVMLSSMRNGASIQLFQSEAPLYDPYV